ncbi:GLPGLI family protein [Chryseobacterium sp. SIMBA_029]|uniref:GLPGLI family protein n=1 Tax=Chryseobacterium sp. SIMBA_029 TaxID=3085772 RepID=UPI0039789B40
MMHKILIVWNILILGASTYMMAQTHRFIYELKYKSDSAQTDYSTQEMVLDINPENVKFYEHDFVKSDSLRKLPNHQYDQHTSQTGQTIARKKGINMNLNYVQIRMMPFYYVFESNDEIKWKIQKETKTIANYKIQMATANFGGRKWIAWFTADIPISEGPYKFRGLPGLILFIEDSKQNFIYSFVRNQNFPFTYNTNEFIESHYILKAIKINYKTWIRLNLDFFNDPYARMRTDFQPDWNVEINGRKIKAKEEFNDLTESTQIEIRTYYNPVELDKAIPYPLVKGNIKIKG